MALWIFPNLHMIEPVFVENFIRSSGGECSGVQREVEQQSLSTCLAECYRTEVIHSVCACVCVCV